MAYRERDGTTIITERKPAGRNSNGPWKLITLNVNSDLQAVGFLAAVTATLAREEISVNAISAFHHDHLLVPKAKAGKAMTALRRLSKYA